MSECEQPTLALVSRHDINPRYDIWEDLPSNSERYGFPPLSTALLYCAPGLTSIHRPEVMLSDAVLEQSIAIKGTVFRVRFGVWTASAETHRQRSGRPHRARVAESLWLLHGPALAASDVEIRASVVSRLVDKPPSPQQPSPPPLLTPITRWG